MHRREGRRTRRAGLLLLLWLLRLQACLKQGCKRTAILRCCRALWSQQQQQQFTKKKKEKTTKMSL